MIVVKRAFDNTKYKLVPHDYEELKRYAVKYITDLLLSEKGVFGWNHMKITILSRITNGYRMMKSRSNVLYLDESVDVAPLKVQINDMIWSKIVTRLVLKSVDLVKLRKCDWYKTVIIINEEEIISNKSIIINSPNIAPPSTRR